MEKEFKYTLEKYSGMKSRHRCPRCNGRGSLTRYIDVETKEPLAIQVGRCEHVNNCGYHFTPKMYFEKNGHLPQIENFNHPSSKPTLKASFHDKIVFDESMSGYAKNNFAYYLTSVFGVDDAFKIIDKYHIGTSKHWPGSTVFWQVDTIKRVMAGKIMLYDPLTGKRVKKPFSHLTWVHSVLKIENFNLRQGFFGQHLIADSSKPIAVVESEKTAVIASIYLPQLTWLACGSLQGLNDDKCGILEGRKVILYPDLKAFEMWSLKAKRYGFAISDLIEKKATTKDRADGLDIADYLLKFKPADFVQQIQETKIIQMHNN